jgi:hypothetical protein
MSITKKDAELQADIIVKKILHNNDKFSELLDGVKNKDDKIRYPNAIALEVLSVKNPDIVYPAWDFFVDLLKGNAYHKSIAISTISNLTKIDKEKKFEEIFDLYFNNIDDKSVIVTRKLAIHAGRIAIAKPHLRSKITTILLSIDETQHNPSRKDLIKGDIIQSFSEYFKDEEEKELIIKFVKNQLNSSSPSTIKKAKEFISIYHI